MIELVLYTRRDCRLCEEMAKDIEEEARGLAVRLATVDVDSRQDLARRFGNDVPVLFVGDVEFARHRLERGRLRQALSGRGRPA
jgi:hypothetical protein